MEISFESPPFMFYKIQLSDTGTTHNKNNCYNPLAVWAAEFSLEYIIWKSKQAKTRNCQYAEFIRYPPEGPKPSRQTDILDRQMDGQRGNSILHTNTIFLGYNYQ